jgi:uncharacterized protein YndB with AHSA1/START domain
VTVATNTIAKHHFRHPASAVFATWLDTEAIGAWMFQPGRDELVSVRLDAVIGGSFSFVVRRDGQLVRHVGKYLELEQDRKLVFTWGVAGDSDDSSKVEVLIEPTSDGCTATVTHQLDPAYADGRDKYAQAWQLMLRRQDERLTAAHNYS